MHHIRRCPSWTKLPGPFSDIVPGKTLSLRDCLQLTGEVVAPTLAKAHSSELPTDSTRNQLDLSLSIAHFSWLQNWVMQHVYQKDLVAEMLSVQAYLLRPLTQFAEESCSDTRGYCSRGNAPV